MPKKKRFRKNAKQKKGEVLEVGPTDPENMENGAKEENKTVNGSSNSHQENKSSNEVHKKKFGLSNKKKGQQNGGNDMVIKEKSGEKSNEGIQRSNSLSYHDSKSRIPMPKFRTLQPKKKHLSASCSNFETTSMVLNPGMDDWRMSGLLNTVEKSNSMFSLNSPVRGTVVEKNPIHGKENMEVQDGPLHLEKVVAPEQSGSVERDTDSISIEHIEICESDESQQKKEETKDDDDNISEKFLETDIDFDMHIAHDLSINETINEADENVETQTETKPHVDVDCKPDEVTPPHIESLTENNPVSIVDKEQVKCPETVSRGETQVYNLDDNNVVVVCGLAKFIEDNHMEMPQEVQSNDWLVLNLSPRVIETC